MSRYLTLIPYLAAQKILKTSARPEIKVKTVQVTNSPGHVSHEPVFSRLTIPVCAISQRDGYAVTASDSYAATEAEPVEITTFSKVHTGSPVPEGYDAVIMHEDVRLDDPGRIMIIRPARPGQNIQKAGSEVKTGSMVIPAGHLISPADVGAMIGYGITSVQVKNIVAGFIPTGYELKEPCTAPGPGEVIASNCEMLAAFLDQAGVESVIYPIVPDDPVQLRNAVELAVRECSFVIISGGSSTGNRDHTESVLSEMGTVLYHGVAMRPGKSTLAAVVDDIPVFGLPGTPAGALAVLRELVIPWLSDTGWPVPVQHTIQVTLADSVPSELGTDDFILLSVGNVHGGYKAMMLPRGGGQMSAVRSDAVLHIGRGSEGMKMGKECLVRLTRTYPHPDNTYLFNGLYDPILDVLDQFLRKKQQRFFCRTASHEATLLSVRHKNTHGGVTIRRGNGGHGRMQQDYSLLEGRAYAITIAEREYILAAKTTPEPGPGKKFTCPGLSDNSQLQQMMDYYLQKTGVNPADIRVIDGYNTEQEIIQGLLEDKIDFGPCSASLAFDYDLQGPVIGCDSIDLVIREEDMESEQVKNLVQLLESDEWRGEAWVIPGYNLERSGHVFLLST
ncbi:MAG: hypothetical protein GX268_01160 [Methanomicrobiales archaeon]|nr:hypothetical protein [Methanomicrobiales archaeon]